MLVSSFQLLKLSTHLLGVGSSEDGGSQNPYILTVRIGEMILLRAEENLLTGDLELTQWLAI